MKTIPGQLKIDSIFIGEVNIDLLPDDLKLRVKVGFHDSKQSKNCGSTMKLGGWSPNTLQKLNEFIEAMEQDLAAEFFEGGATGGGGEGGGTTIDGVPQL